jgi:hypothetical protein
MVVQNMNKVKFVAIIFIPYLSYLHRRSTTRYRTAGRTQKKLGRYAKFATSPYFPTTIYLLARNPLGMENVEGSVLTSLFILAYRCFTIAQTPFSKR